VQNVTNSSAFPAGDVLKGMSSSREEVRDAVLELQLIRAKIDNLQATLSSRFNSEALYQLE